MFDTDIFNNNLKVKPKKLNILPANPESNDEEAVVGLGRFPSWLHRKLPKGSDLSTTDKIMRSNRLHTVCEEAKCPNLIECWSKKTATYLILGKECTRSCGFCEIGFSKSPPKPEDDEPQRVAESVKELGLKHVVITMVARDDLPDGGAAHLVAVMRAVRQHNPDITLEVLTSDFAGNEEAWNLVLEENPDIFNHNIETVRQLTQQVRHKATYDRTLKLLSYAKEKAKTTLIKSGLMVGLGETKEQIQETLRDLHNTGCDIVTIGQYLQANRLKLRVKAFVHPDEFREYEEYGLNIGIKQMFCGPFVRSSYHAGETLVKTRLISTQE